MTKPTAGQQLYERLIVERGWTRIPWLELHADTRAMYEWKAQPKTPQSLPDTKGAKT